MLIVRPRPPYLGRRHPCGTCTADCPSRTDLPPEDLLARKQCAETELCPALEPKSAFPGAAGCVERALPQGEEPRLFHRGRLCSQESHCCSLQSDAALWSHTTPPPLALAADVHPSADADTPACRHSRLSRAAPLSPLQNAPVLSWHRAARTPLPSRRPHRSQRAPSAVWHTHPLLPAFPSPAHRERATIQCTLQLTALPAYRRLRMVSPGRALEKRVDRTVAPPLRSPPWCRFEKQTSGGGCLPPHPPRLGIHQHVLDLIPCATHRRSMVMTASTHAAQAASRERPGPARWRIPVPLGRQHG